MKLHYNLTVKTTIFELPFEFRFTAFRASFINAIEWLHLHKAYQDDENTRPTAEEYLLAKLRTDGICVFCCVR